jgi:transposase
MLGLAVPAGHPRAARWLLVQAAQSMMRVQSPRAAELRRWAETIAARRGKKVAVVSLARKMAGILYAMLRDGTVYKSKVANRTRTAAA